MSVNTDELRALPAAEKLRIVEMLWDDLGEMAGPIPLPDWVGREAIRRRDEMRSDSRLGLGHEEVWGLIDKRNG